MNSAMVNVAPMWHPCETAPRNISRLFDGSHNGKLIIKVGEEP